MVHCSIKAASQTRQALNIKAKKCVTILCRFHPLMYLCILICIDKHKNEQHRFRPHANTDG